MKTKTYRNGSFSCKGYCRDAGNGWEVGFYYGKKLIFVGNFIHQSEATRWYRLMNREVRTFSRRYTVGRTYPKAWFAKFLGAQLYRTYYAFLNKCFAKYSREFSRATTQNQRTYKRMTRQWRGTSRTPFLKAA
jgi:hypothetical protein